MNIKDVRIAVIGLGYVGLPLARLFSTKFPTVGYDLNKKRVDALMEGHDATLEVSDELLPSTTMASAARPIWMTFGRPTSMWWQCQHLSMPTTSRTCAHCGAPARRWAR